MRHVVIAAATSAMMHTLLRRWLQQGPLTLSLIGRDPEKLRILQQDLLIRQPLAEIHCYTCDFEDSASIKDTLQRIHQKKPVDIALLAQGALPDQTLCQEDPAACAAALMINAVSPVLFASILVKQFAAQQHGHLVILSSVAGDRGRQSNYVYGASKGLLNRFAEGLQHRFAHTPITITLVKPGPTDTPMTWKLKAEGMRMASVEEVAALILQAIEKKRPLCYAPRRWQWIMLIIRHLPRRIFHRLQI